jgi:hypothetical protein
MGQFSTEKPVAPGSALSGNQQPENRVDRSLARNQTGKRKVVITRARAQRRSNLPLRGPRLCGYCQAGERSLRVPEQGHVVGVWHLGGT